MSKRTPRPLDREAVLRGLYAFAADLAEGRTFATGCLLPTGEMPMGHEWETYADDECRGWSS